SFRIETCEVDFNVKLNSTYTKDVSDEFGINAGVSATNPKTIPNDVEISVPFIALLNVPSFRIETCEVDFNVKLNSTYTKDVSDEFGINAGV
ncbi:DUF2589 domain-containing protein, partial [Chryseobacterium sp. CH1]|uniref:DUF2589 domain-containing protein n=1 Tax=Chryseobacterium sp. CH1 TaxID=713551 RepID=UPI00100A4F4C